MMGSGTGSFQGTTGTGFSGTGGSFGGSGRTGTTYTGPGTTNLYRSYYGNPYSLGMPSGATQPAFGQPTYGTIYTTTTTTGVGTGFAGGGLTGTSTGNLSGTSVSFSTIGMRRAAPYTTEIAADLPLNGTNGGNGGNGPGATGAPSRLQTEVKGVLDRSSALTSSGSIQVSMSGETVVLRGTVPNAREKRLAEGMIRLTPGVRDVRNELKIGP